jgi:hypothetical protein
MAKPEEPKSKKMKIKVKTQNGDVDVKTNEDEDPIQLSPGESEQIYNSPDTQRLGVILYRHSSPG